MPCKGRLVRLRGHRLHGPPRREGQLRRRRGINSNWRREQDESRETGPRSQGRPGPGSGDAGDGKEDVAGDLNTTLFVDNYDEIKK